MYPAAPQSKVKIKMLKGELVGTIWREPGEIADATEDVAVRLVHEGVASLDRGVKLSADGSARLAKLARENPRRPEPPPVPTVQVKNDSPVEVFAYPNSLAPGETAAMQEDFAAIAVSKGLVQLAPGATFSKRGAAYFDKLSRYQSAEY